MPCILLKDEDLDLKLRETIPAKLVFQETIFPLKTENGSISIALSDGRLLDVRYREALWTPTHTPEGRDLLFDRDLQFLATLFQLGDRCLDDLSKTCLRLDDLLLESGSGCLQCGDFCFNFRLGAD